MEWMLAAFPCAMFLTYVSLSRRPVSFTFTFLVALPKKWQELSWFQYFPLDNGTYPNASASFSRFHIQVFSEYLLRLNGQFWLALETCYLEVQAMQAQA